MSKKSFAVIGLGQFGRAVVDELLENGMDVIAIDNDPEAINKVAKKLPTSFVADSTDEEAMKELGLKDVDAVIVAYGDNKEASILTTVILREFGIEEIIVRVDDDYYALYKACSRGKAALFHAALPCGKAPRPDRGPRALYAWSFRESF